MRILISAEGEHDPPAHYMQVDNHGLLIDLSRVTGTLVDPTIRRVEWGPTIIAGESREAGSIYRQDGGRQTFFDVTLLKPYLDAWTAKRDALKSSQENYHRAERDLANKVVVRNIFPTSSDPDPGPIVQVIRNEPA